MTELNNISDKRRVKNYYYCKSMSFFLLILIFSLIFYVILFISFTFLILLFLTFFFVQLLISSFLLEEILFLVYPKLINPDNFIFFRVCPKNALQRNSLKKSFGKKWEITFCPQKGQKKLFSLFDAQMPLYGSFMLLFLVIWLFPMFL